MKKAGADIIVALSHSGIGQADYAEGLENATVPLASVGGIDAFLTGHSHLVFPGPNYDGFAGMYSKAVTIMGKPGVMAGF